MTAKQREEFKYIAGWIFGLSYTTDQTTAEGLVDITECIEQLLREDEVEQKHAMDIAFPCVIEMMDDGK